MKRDPALVSLSHDHHQVLRVAQTLRRARADTVNEARAMFLTYWVEHGNSHFRAEEEILLPAFAAHGDAHHPLVARALCDHVEIRRHAHELGADIAPEPDVLHELAERLAEHVRLEERELFPMIEHTIPAAHLLVVGETLDRFEHPADR